MTGKINNLTGQRFGRLVVLSDSGIRKGGRVVWACECDCGNFTFPRGNSLLSGTTRSCGCLRKEMFEEIIKNRTIKHGDSRNKAKLYCTWAGMKTRCFNKRHSDYKYYGKKGIRVCKEWASDYTVFKSWAILNGYQEGLTIDRINSNRGYEPNNCRFITKSENSIKANRKRWDKFCEYKR